MKSPFCTCSPGTHHFHSLHPRPTFQSHQLPHYFQSFHSCLKLIIFYSLFQSPSDSHNFRTFSSPIFPIRLLHLQVHIHRPMHISLFLSFQLSHTILNPFHSCASMPYHILRDIRSAHPSFSLPLLFSSTPIHNSHSPSYNLSLNNLLYGFLVPP